MNEFFDILKKIWYTITRYVLTNIYHCDRIITEILRKRNDIVIDTKEIVVYKITNEYNKNKELSSLTINVT